MRNTRYDIRQVSDTNVKNTQKDGQRDNAGTVLVIENDSETARVLLQVLARKGIRASLARDVKTATDIVEGVGCDLIFVSERILKAPRKTSAQSNCASEHVFGSVLLQKIKRHMPELPVIVMAGPDFGCSPEGKEQLCQYGTPSKSPQDTQLKHAVAGAVEAVRMGCCDFVIKPLDSEKVETILDSFLPNHDVCAIDSAEDNARCLYQIVGKSAKLAHTVELARRIAPSSAPVLISGESGTGKELLSYLIHHRSKRAQGPFVKVNCAALSDSLLESELFGHEKGAFTGAYSRRRGRFEMAHGGTLLLDEVTETPLRFQAKLLRVLEQQDFERVGGNENIRVNVRIISTTNKELVREVERGRFRQDLYYRLSGLRLVISPLRQRPEDLPELVWYFVNLYAREAHRRITRLEPVMMDVFSKYHWPGNVRQLRNVVRTCLILGAGETLSLADVWWLFDGPYFCGNTMGPDGGEIRQSTEPAGGQAGWLGRSVELNGGLGGVPLERLERQAILETLQQNSGNQTKAAKVLGISDRTLRDKIRRYRREGCLQAG